MKNALEVLERPSGITTNSLQWDQIVDMVAAAFRFTKEETERFRSREIAQLIAAIPFLAGCKDPKRTAISHLGTYILSVRIKEEANARPSDDEYLHRRLELIGNFIGGDQEIIQRGMDLIALCMLYDYKRDEQEDQESGKYNPITAGLFDFEKQEQKLINRISSIRCDIMDDILPVARCRTTFWIIS